MSTTPTQTPNPTLAWVFDGDSVLCQEGVPHAITVDDLSCHDDVFTLSGHYLLTFTQIQSLGMALVGEFVPYRQLVATLTADMTCQFSTAIQLLTWQHTHRFCGVCGTPTQIANSEYAKVCPNCRHHSYPKIQPCVIVAITRKNPNTQKQQILLAKHHRHAHANMYGLIAGYVEVGESLENAVHREVLEETGLHIKNLHYLESQAWPYPTNLMLGFVAEYESGVLAPQADELADVQFFDLDNLPHIPNIGTIARRLIDLVCLQH
ncbi:NAD(+) diphosphatase [Moraxella oblonga]|uniref:NAD(+) diphosphatase n=1 Tax=Moraxella oblonga TaxID=200413 RepID=UPI000A7A2327|nr:NAD(+) diphosphatase [Moraxella oblonga]